MKWAISPADLPGTLLYNFGFLQLVGIDTSAVVTDALGGQPRNMRMPLGMKFVMILSGLKPGTARKEK